MKMMQRIFLAAALGLLFVAGCKKEDIDDGNAKPKIVVQSDAPVTDFDGNVYATVKIGRQVWMAENLRVTHFRSGGAITAIQLSGQWGANTSLPAYCYYDNQADSAVLYGALYNGKAVTSSSQLAPAGWRIPTTADLTQLRVYLDSFDVEEGALKAAGLTYWRSPNTGGTNSTLFNALPGGYRFVNGDFQLKGYKGQWWLNDGSSSFLLLNDEATMHTGTGSSQYGYSVRCIKE